MAKDLNKCQFIGRLGADPEMRYTPAGSAVTTLRLACGRSWKDSDGTQHDDTEWVRVVAWNKLGEICHQYLTKGSRCYIEGRMQTRKYQDSDGNDRYSTEIIASDMIMLDGKSRSADAADGEDEYQAAEPAPAPAKAAASTNGNGNGASRSPSTGRATKIDSPPPAPPRPARNVPQEVSEEELPF